METQIQEAVSSFRRPAAKYMLIVPGIVLAAGLFLAFLTAVTSYAWGTAVILVIPILAGLSFVFLNWPELVGLVADKQAPLKFTAAVPSVQKQNVNLEVMELAKLLDISDEHRTELLTSYIVAEDLALRQIQQEQNSPILRQVTVGNVSFDALAVRSDLLTCIEVSFLVSPELRQDKVDSMLKKTERVREMLTAAGSSKDVRLLIVLVTQLEPAGEAKLRSTLNTRRFSHTNVDIDVRLLDFETLQLSYLTE